MVLPLRSVGRVAADVEDSAFDGYVCWEVGVGAWWRAEVRSTGQPSLSA